MSTTATPTDLPPEAAAVAAPVKPAPKARTRPAARAEATDSEQAPERPASKAVVKAVVKKVARPAPVKVAKAAKAPESVTASAAPAVASAPAHAKPAKLKEKLVRDSFTMPRSDFALVQRLKDRALGFRRAAKKSELLRAGLHALMALDNDRLQAALAALPTLKAGRPRKAD
jgi:hypothetical protein